MKKLFSRRSRDKSRGRSNKQEVNGKVDLPQELHGDPAISPQTVQDSQVHQESSTATATMEGGTVDDQQQHQQQQQYEHQQHHDEQKSPSVHSGVNPDPCALDVLLHRYGSSKHQVLLLLVKDRSRAEQDRLTQEELELLKSVRMEVTDQL